MSKKKGIRTTKGKGAVQRKDPPDVKAADDLMDKLLRVPKSEVDELEAQRHKRSKPA